MNMMMNIMMMVNMMMMMMNMMMMNMMTMNMMMMMMMMMKCHFQVKRMEKQGFLKYFATKFQGGNEKNVKVSGPCAAVGFGPNGVEPVGSANTEPIN